MSSGLTITNFGRNMLASALTGQELKFTRAEVGDGYLNGKTIATMNALISPRKTLAIQSIRASATGICEVVLALNNEGLSKGFWLREYGLFAKDPSTGAEQLYAYTNTGDESGYLEGQSGSNIIDLTMTLITVIDQAPNVSAVVSTTNNYVTVSRLEARVQDIFASDADLAGLWTYGRNSEGRLTPRSWNDIKTMLLGTADIQTMHNRIKALENNIADTLLALEIQEIYPDYQCYIIEDFRNPDQCDTFSCKITSIVAGDDSIDCDPVDGILPGSWYTISDGVNSENVQIGSVNIENEIQRIILTKNIINTYRLENTRMYRTSAAITPEGAGGAGIRKSCSWQPNISWQGKAANASVSQELSFTEGNSANFILSGKAVFSVNGELTLGA